MRCVQRYFCTTFLWTLFILVFPLPVFAQDDVQDLARYIDQQVEDLCHADKVPLSPLTNDAEFLRRVYLDIAGKIPPASEVRRFSESPNSNKRRDKIDELLDSPRYIAHFTNVLRKSMLPEAQLGNFRFAQEVQGFQSWLRTQLSEETGYDRIAYRLITSDPTTAGMRVGPSTRSAQRTPTPAAFFVLKEGRPENIAASISRQFLGLRLECAQCHDHPFASWKQQEFWGLAAFFAGLQQTQDTTVNMRASTGKLSIPGTRQVVFATHLDGSPANPIGSDYRQALAEWVTSKDNPYFAKAAVNRLWAHFFGVGIVTPFDDMEPDNLPSHPQLLDALADRFVEHEYDLKFLIRSILNSKSYQRSSKQIDEVQEDPRYFSRALVRGLSPEQLFDSLAQATGTRNDQATNAFSGSFTEESSMPIDTQTSILQALAMMNGQFVSNATDLQNSVTLAAVTEFPLFSPEQVVETLYLAALSRFPTAEETEKFVEYLETGGPENDEKKAAADIFWALLNSSEFLFNH